MMEIQPHHILGGGGAIAAVGVAWGISKATVKSMTNQMGSVWDEIEKLRKSVADHEKDAMTRRLEIEKTFSQFRENNGRKSQQYDEIIRRLDGLDKKIDRFEDDKN